MADNIFPEGDVITQRVDVAPDFGDAAEEMATLVRLFAEGRQDAEGMANAAAELDNRLQVIAADRREDLETNEKILAIREKLQEIGSQSTEHVRSQREETEALVELQQRLKDIGQDTHLLDIPDAPEVAEKMETAIRSVRTAAAREFTGEFADVGEQIADAMRNLEGGNLGKGVLEVSSAVEALNRRHAELSERQLGVYTRLVDMAGDLKDAAIEISGTMDGAGGPSRAGGSGPGESPSSLAGIYARINPRLAGPNAEQGAVQSLTSMLPGAGGSGVGGALTGSAVQGLGASAFGALGGAAVPAAAAAAVGYMGYQQFQQYAMQMRGYERTAGEMGFGQTFEYDMQARTMALSPFMDDKQARDVINEVLKSGRSGIAADNAIEYVASNFRKFNMAAVDSMKFYELAVGRAGASTDSLTNTLENLHETAGETGVSVATLENSFTNITGTLVGQGGGPESVPVAGAISQLFAFGPGATELSNQGITPDVFLGSDLFKTNWAQNMGAPNWLEVAPYLTGPNALPQQEQVATFQQTIEDVFEPYMDMTEEEALNNLYDMNISTNAWLGVNFSQGGTLELLKFLQGGGFGAARAQLREQASEWLPTREGPEGFQTPQSIWAPSRMWQGLQGIFRGSGGIGPFGDAEGGERARWSNSYQQWQSDQGMVPGAPNRNPMMESLMEGSNAFNKIVQWEDEYGLHTMKANDWISSVGMERAIEMLNDGSVSFAELPEDFSNSEGEMSNIDWAVANLTGGLEDVQLEAAAETQGVEWANPIDTFAGPGSSLGLPGSGEGSGTYSMGQGAITVDITPRAAAALDISYTDSGEASTGNATNTEQTRTGARNRNHGWDAGGLW